jgi:hypothetical protein
MSNEAGWQVQRDREVLDALPSSPLRIHHSASRRLSPSADLIALVIPRRCVDPALGALFRMRRRALRWKGSTRRWLAKHEKVSAAAEVPPLALGSRAEGRVGTSGPQSPNSRERDNAYATAFPSFDPPMSHR